MQVRTRKSQVWELNLKSPRSIEVLLTMNKEKFVSEDKKNHKEPYRYIQGLTKKDHHPQV